MILELDTNFFKLIEDLTINQLVFLTLVLNENKSNHQDIHEFLSRISEDEIQELVHRDYVVVNVSDDRIEYHPSKKLIALTATEITYFDEFYEVFPVYVTRPDGTKGFLRANVNKCKKEYNKVVGKSRAMHEHLLECLKYEVSQKAMTGKLGYFKTMWKWITNREWEAIEDEMKFNKPQYEEPTYGNTVF